MPPPLRRSPPPPAPTAGSVIDRIQKRAGRVNLSTPHDVLSGLDRYLQLLARWNAKINLTAFRLEEPSDEAIDRLLIEPIVAARHLPQRRFALIDVGSGSGSPGIPLRLAAPAASLTLVESKTRKAVFLSEAVRHLALAGASVETARFEQLLTRPELHEAFDVLSIRAVRVEPKTLLTLQALLKPGGQIFWFTGTNGASALPAIVPLSHVATYPLLESLRSALVVFGKHSAR
jgi:16S rRNA (guanine527-N7)-methyltransferase